MIPALDLGASREVRIRGSLKKKRKEAIDEGFVKASLDFIEGANLEKKPFFVWFTPTRMHIWAHLRPESQARIPGPNLRPESQERQDLAFFLMAGRARRTGPSPPDDDLGIADNAIVIDRQTTAPCGGFRRRRP
jgi:arylsulfatase